MLYELTVTQFNKMFHNLLAILDKANTFAETKKIDTEVLLNCRLAPDQFPLLRQIQIACDTAKLGAARLTTKEAPSHPDTEKTMAEVKARIESVVSYLETLTVKDYEAASERHITQPRWEGQYLTGHEYVVNHVIPNFYFHMTTAYSILRHNGVEVGKKDYLGKMPYKK